MVADDAAVTVVVAAPRLPGRAAHRRRGRAGWTRPRRSTGVAVLHAGTALDGAGQVVTSAGGRVLSVVGTGADLAAARERGVRRGRPDRPAPAAHHRTDIAADGRDGECARDRARGAHLARLRPRRPELAQQVVDSGYRPDLVLTIARGGLIPAGALGYALDVKNLVVVNVEFYTGVDQRLDVPVFLPPVPAAVDLAGSRMLVVDDVADTGETLAAGARLLRRPRGARRALRCSTRSRSRG